MIPPPETSWVTWALDELTQLGFRRGKSRTALLELLNKQDCALSHLEMEQLLQASGDSTSHASIYRILEELEGAKIIQRIQLGSGLTRWERIGGHHHHFLCSSCGNLYSFQDIAFEQAMGNLFQKLPHQVTEHDVTLQGLCQNCLLLDGE
jgi:Fur family ferric uptake transcriptional regulator